MIKNQAIVGICNLLEMEFDKMHIMILFTRQTFHRKIMTSKLAFWNRLEQKKCAIGLQKYDVCNTGGVLKKYYKDDRTGKRRSAGLLLYKLFFDGGISTILK
jgi:hypothetical protein